MENHKKIVLMKQTLVGQKYANVIYERPLATPLGKIPEIGMCSSIITFTHYAVYAQKC